MVPSLSIGPRALFNDRNHSATAIFWRSAICMSVTQTMALFTSGSAPRTTRASATQIVSKSGYKLYCRAVGSRIVLLFYRRVFWAFCRTVRNRCIRMTSNVASRIVTAFSPSISCRCMFWADSSTVRDECLRMTRNVANRIVMVFSQSIACRLAHEKDTRTAF